MAWISVLAFALALSSSRCAGHVDTHTYSEYQKLKHGKAMHEERLTRNLTSMRASMSDMKEREEIESKLSSTDGRLQHMNGNFSGAQKTVAALRASLTQQNASHAAHVAHLRAQMHTARESVAVIADLFSNAHKSLATLNSALDDGGSAGNLDRAPLGGDSAAAAMATPRQGLLTNMLDVQPFSIIYTDSRNHQPSKKFKTTSDLLDLAAASLMSLKATPASSWVAQRDPVVVCSPMEICAKLEQRRVSGVDTVLYEEPAGMASPNWVVQTDVLKLYYMRRSTADYLLYFELDMLFVRSPSLLLGLAYQPSSGRCDAAFTWGNNPLYGTVNTGLQYFRNSRGVLALQQRLIEGDVDYTARRSIQGGENQIVIDQLLGPSVPFGQARTLVLRTPAGGGGGGGGGGSKEGTHDLRVCSIDMHDVSVEGKTVDPNALCTLRNQSLAAALSHRMNRSQYVIALHFIGPREVKMRMMSVAKCFREGMSL